MACPITPSDCLTDGIGSVVSGLANSAFEQVVQAFVSAANTLLESFAKAFTLVEGPDLGTPAIKTIYSISLGVAITVACLLLLGQIIRTVITHDGSSLASGVVGLGKAVLIILLTLTVSTAALKASDELTDFIIKQTFGSTRQLTEKIAGVIIWTPGSGVALLLLLAVVGILLTLVLWFELLLRNAAVVVLIATSPIAAVGQVNEGTKQWWTKTATAAAQLIVLKPVVALVFAVGFGMTGESSDLQGLLSGMLILLLAVFAWPVIARFFSFASVAVGGSAGLGALLGFTAGRVSTSGGGNPVGVQPEQFSRDIETRTMAQAAAGNGPLGGSVAGATPSASGSGAGAAGAAGAGVVAVAAMALQAGQKAINSLAGGMDSMAHHGGMHGRPAHYAAGTPAYASRYRYSGQDGFHGGTYGQPPTNPPAKPLAEAGEPAGPTASPASAGAKGDPGEPLITTGADHAAPQAEAEVNPGGERSPGESVAVAEAAATAEQQVPPADQAAAPDSSEPDAPAPTPDPAPVSDETPPPTRPAPLPTPEPEPQPEPESGEASDQKGTS